MLYCGSFGSDANGIYPRITPYDTDEEDRPLLSVAYPFELHGIARKLSAPTPVLKDIVSRTTAESNPVLVWYDFKGK